MLVGMLALEGDEVLLWHVSVQVLHETSLAVWALSNNSLSAWNFFCGPRPAFPSDKCHRHLFLGCPLICDFSTSLEQSL